MKKVILVIRDGWGYRESTEHNAIHNTATPITDGLMKHYPNTLLNASGEAVGLPKGYQGNSEVGHMTIGSGRIINQSLSRINKSIEDKSFFKISEFSKAINNCKKNKSKLHIMGLLQVEGVHSHIDHLFALLDLCKKKNFKRVVVHVFTDGRDAPVNNSLKHVKKLLNKFKEIGFGEIVTVSGRYYSMDRDKRWDRTKKAYDCIVNGDSKDEFSNPLTAIKKCHANDETDEFIKPQVLKGYHGVKKNDSMIFFNFRTDRTRQLTKAIVEDKFEGWNRKKLNVLFVAMTPFYKPMNAEVAFKERKIDNLLGEIVSKNGLKQFRVSETEKYAHVTFFFNGQIEKPFKNEDRFLINSPKVVTYDLQPEMSVYEIADALVKQIKTEKYDLIVTNLVNGDMVGHTGIIHAIKKAVKAVDLALGRIVDEALKHDYTMLIFGDHGNVEDQTAEWRTSHTINPVPLIVVSNDLKMKLPKNKGLQDIAPTVLKLLGLKKPVEMTGESLV
ncbi:MAG: 2,3-bisphosphoglycerate-independent phosphoglycerate mutase [archaeon]